MSVTPPPATVEDGLGVPRPTTPGPAPHRGPSDDHARDRALAGGLVALTIATILLQVLLGEIIPPVLVFDVLFLALAVGLLRSSARWLRWSAVALSLLLLIANAPFAAGDLAHPESFAGFAPTLAIVLIALGNMVLGIGAARGRQSSGTRTWGLIGVVLALGITVSAIATSGVTDDAPVPGDVALSARALAFPDVVAVPATATGIVVTNADPFRHTFVIDGRVDAVEVPGGTARRVPIDLPAGEYRFHCDIAGHESMEGTLVVR